MEEKERRNDELISTLSGEEVKRKEKNKIGLGIVAGAGILGFAYSQEAIAGIKNLDFEKLFDLKDLNDAYAIILSWNMKEILIPKIQQINDKIGKIINN